MGKITVTKPKWSKKYISRNYTNGRNGYEIREIFLHTYGGKGRSLKSWFNNKDTKASAHFSVFLDGKMEKYVSESNTAWHAGTKSMPNSNWISIGIEHQDNDDPWDKKRTDKLYESSAKLVAYFCQKYDIPCKLLSKKETNDKKRGICLHNQVSSKPCPAGLDVKRIVKRANEIIKESQKEEEKPEYWDKDGQTYTKVIEGEGISQIAKRYGYPNYGDDKLWKMITEWNGGNNWDYFNKTLKAGQSIVIDDNKVESKDEQDPVQEDTTIDQETFLEPSEDKKNNLLKDLIMENNILQGVVEYVMQFKSKKFSAFVIYICIMLLPDMLGEYTLTASQEINITIITGIYLIIQTVLDMYLKKAE